MWSSRLHWKLLRDATKTLGSFADTPEHATTPALARELPSVACRMSEGGVFGGMRDTERSQRVSLWRALFLLHRGLIAFCDCILQIGTTVWRKPLLTKLEGCDGAFGATDWLVRTSRS
jgi:hypothetical protein